jgi:hypothetical protein
MVQDFGERCAKLLHSLKLPAECFHLLAQRSQLRSSRSRLLALLLLRLEKPIQQALSH